MTGEMRSMVLLVPVVPLGTWVSQPRATAPHAPWMKGRAGRGAEEASRLPRLLAQREAPIP
jgi:hypothetical protein